MEVPKRINVLRLLLVPLENILLLLLLLTTSTVTTSSTTTTVIIITPCLMGIHTGSSLPSFVSLPTDFTINRPTNCALVSFLSSYFFSKFFRDLHLLLRSSFHRFGNTRGQPLLYLKALDFTPPPVD